MDNIQRAIEILQRNKPTSDPRLCGKELCNACDIAIAAMLELQRYRELGLTPNQIRQIDKLYLEKCQEVNALKGQIVDAALETIIKLSEGTENE